jgi:hypothetical protein
MAWHNTTSVSSRTLLHSDSHYQVIVKDKKFQMDGKMPTHLGKNQTMLHGCTNFDFTSLGH